MKTFPEKLPALFFAEESFSLAYREYINAYVELRIRRHSAVKAFRTVFGEHNFDDDKATRLSALERNQYYQDRFNQRLQEIPVADMWNTKIALFELIELMNDIFVKETVRLTAIKELNLLCGITVVDENGKTKAGRTLADFYAKEGITPTPVDSNNQEEDDSNNQ